MEFWPDQRQLVQRFGLGFTFLGKQQFSVQKRRGGFFQVARLQMAGSQCVVGVSKKLGVIRVFIFDDFVDGRRSIRPGFPGKGIGFGFLAFGQQFVLLGRIIVGMHRQDRIEGGQRFVVFSQQVQHLATIEITSQDKFGPLRIRQLRKLFFGKIVRPTANKSFPRSSDGDRSERFAGSSRRNHSSVCLLPGR